MRFWRRSAEDIARGLEPNDPVPPSFPFRLSDRELDAVLRDMMAALPGFDRYQALLPELKLTLILNSSPSFRSSWALS
jgi:hypothetical protein